MFHCDSDDEIAYAIRAWPVEAERERLHGGAAGVPDPVIADLAAHFAAPRYGRLPGNDPGPVVTDTSRSKASWQ